MYSGFKKFTKIKNLKSQYIGKKGKSKMRFEYDQSEIHLNSDLIESIEPRVYEGGFKCLLITLTSGKTYEVLER